MKVQLRAIVQAKSALEKLLSADLDDVKARFLLRRLFRAASEELKHFDEARTPLLQKYGTETEPGRFVVEPKNIQAFTKELDQILECEVTLDYEPISYEQTRGVKLSAADMHFLDAFITDKGEPK